MDETYQSGVRERSRESSSCKDCRDDPCEILLDVGRSGQVDTKERVLVGDIGHEREGVEGERANRLGCRSKGENGGTRARLVGEDEDGGMEDDDIAVVWSVSIRRG